MGSVAADRRRNFADGGRPRQKSSMISKKRLAKTASKGDRRGADDRRRGQDRRELPPRPEGRRKTGGRRQGDPEDA